MNRDQILKLSEEIVLPEANVEFESADKELKLLVDKANNLAENNIKIFGDGFKVLVEGGGYSRIYAETQPMGGEMFAKRQLLPALNNQLLFMLCQRNDGRIPGSIMPVPNRKNWQEEDVCMWMSADSADLGLVASFEQLQGNALPYPAFKMYYLIGKPKEYLKLLAESIESFDNYLWKTRDPYDEGILQAWCEWDTGEDNCVRFGASPTRWPHDYPPDGKNTPDPGNPEDRKRYYLWSHVSETMGKNSVKVPIRSMDMMAYSYENRAVLAMISEELDDGKSDYWLHKAEEIREAFRNNLWRPELGAAYDKDRHNVFMETLIHNNLRCMWYGLFNREMAKEFVSRHLFNPEEFFTPLPLPSIAANDPLFQNCSSNNWSGPVQSLTWQRLIRALENYGLYSELTLLGRIFIKTIRKHGVFVQQFDPFDRDNSMSEEELKRDGYGPCVLAFLEYISRFAGVYIEHEHIYWSGLKDAGGCSYTQVFDKKRFSLKNDGKSFSAFINDVFKFSCSVGARVCTDMDGQPYQIVGIDTHKQKITFNHNSNSNIFDIEPNQIMTINSSFSNK